MIWILLLMTFSCQNSNEKDAKIQEKIKLIKDNPLDSIHPNNLSEDLSWIVSLDIQEGFLISYTITHQSGEEKLFKVDETAPFIGGVDQPEPYFLNDTTYFIPHVGGSSKGYYEMYIYQNGKSEYKEVIN